MFNEELKERAILVSLLIDKAAEETDRSLMELAELTKTAGAKIVAQVTQRGRPDPKTYVGSGKAIEITNLTQELDADTIIFNEDLTPSQQANLEAITSRKIIDRTTLILDIFAQRAQTKEGKIQVEMAQLTHRLSRLKGKGVALSRLGAGIGTRGPGETKLEVERRGIGKRIQRLKLELSKIEKVRQTQKKQRVKRGLFRLAIVGYTNAGKSTLLNALTKSNVLAEDKLFATLDPASKRLEVGGGTPVTISDTVGFIRDLPHHLVAAFKSTLEEVIEADLLLHVIDASHTGFDQQIASVESILNDLKVMDADILSVFNKIDRISTEYIKRLKKVYPDAVFVSAKEGMGLEGLKERIRKIASVPNH
ncbi:MAG: GTPase HflX [Actinomycetota bacterium]|nr:GTPase HflX [Actinomycetota bacterium]